MSEKPTAPEVADKLIKEFQNNPVGIDPYTLLNQLFGSDRDVLSFAVWLTSRFVDLGILRLSTAEDVVRAYLPRPVRQDTLDTNPADNGGDEFVDVTTVNLLMSVNQQLIADYQKNELPNLTYESMPRETDPARLAARQRSQKANQKRNPRWPGDARSDT